MLILDIILRMQVNFIPSGACFLFSAMIFKSFLHSNTDMIIVIVHRIKKLYIYTYIHMRDSKGREIKKRKLKFGVSFSFLCFMIEVFHILTAIENGK